MAQITPLYRPDGRTMKEPAVEPGMHGHVRELCRASAAQKVDDKTYEAATYQAQGR